MQWKRNCVILKPNYPYYKTTATTTTIIITTRELLKYEQRDMVHAV